MPGLLHKNVLEAAELDRKPIPWCVQADATPGSAGRLVQVKGLMTACLSLRPEGRPSLPDLHSEAAALLEAEMADVRSTGYAIPGTVPLRTPPPLHVYHFHGFGHPLIRGCAV